MFLWFNKINKGSRKPLTTYRYITYPLNKRVIVEESPATTHHIENMKELLSNYGKASSPKNLYSLPSLAGNVLPLVTREVIVNEYATGAPFSIFKVA